MPMPVTYTTFCGHVVYEDRGGTERYYVRDPQGSTIAMTDGAGSVTDSWTYWPYGEVESHTGGSTTPLTYLGTLGYFLDYASKYYVRSRDYRADSTRWLEVDPLWPWTNAYGYADHAPLKMVDPTGLTPACQGSYLKVWYGPPPYTDPVQPGLPIPWLTTDIVEFGYGNCCGAGTKCSGTFLPPVEDPPSTGRAIDCVDGRCAWHDDCMSGPLEVVLRASYCQKMLCFAMIRALKNGCCAKKNTPHDCVAAARLVAGFACGTALFLPG